ncbi:hypothetical protein JCM1840_001616 [Sporobolomyces johnsonii]
MLAFDGTSSLCPFSFTDPRLYSLKKIVAQRDFTSRPIPIPLHHPESPRIKTEKVASIYLSTPPRTPSVWTIGSRLSNDGTRTFHHFTRSITITGLPTSPASFAPAPPSSSSPLAVVVSPNSFWAFTPSLWDPHVSLLGSRQSFSSPTGTLPAWLSWNEGSLTGVPPQDAVGKTWEVTIVGTLEGKDKGDVESIERTLALEVREARGAAPVAA